ncbi:MAG: bifunctional chorismate mutase/prephenate dehydrogenase [Deferrisomatales bacterium]
MAERNELEALRERIDRIDGELVRLLGERRAVVEQVAEIKKRRNLPLYHPAREEDLISRRREEARRAGLDPDTVEDVFRRLLRASRVSQSAALAAHAVRPGARVLLVGGRGAMGRCLERWFGEAGYEVRVLDRDDWPRAEELCREVDLALLSVPIDATPAVARRLGPLLPAGSVLADITSVKRAPLEAMLEAHRGPVLGLHPMFGPTTTTMDKQIVVVTPGRGREAWTWVLEQLAAWGAVLVEAGAEEHDEAMAVVQALRHFATFTFGQFLCRKGVDLERSLEFSAPIYRLELGMVGRLFAQDPALYAEIIFATPERRQLLRDYVESMGENLALLEAGDKEGFCREFRKIARWFGPFGDQAMRESSYLIEKLVERF